MGKKRVLYICGLHPTYDDAVSGIFISRRLENLAKSEKISYCAPIFYVADSNMVKLLKYILIKDNNEYEEKNYQREKNKYFPYNLYFYKEFKRGLLDYIKKYYYLHLMNLYTKITREYRPHLIHAHWLYPHGYIAVKIGEKFNIPVVITCHGSDINVEMSKKRSIRRHSLFALEKANKIIFVSEALRESAISEGFSGKSSIIINNGLDLEKFNIISKQKVSQKLNLNLDHKYVGFVGSLTEKKGADRLPEIFNNIDKIKKTEFIIIGNGVLRSKIEKECINKKLDVKFLGKISPDQVPFYMNLLDTLVIPSRNESWGCVIKEAQACGIPVVGSDNGGIPEAIGNGGIIVPEGENFEKRFSLAVASILEKSFDRKKIRENSLEYDWWKIVNNEIEVYEELLKKIDL